MSIILPKTCAMGGSKTGLVGTIGVTLLNPDGTVHTARATADIYEIGGGCYGKEIAFDDNWKGSIKWDTGGGSPVYATEDYDVEGLIDMIEEDTSKMNFVGTDIKATLDGEKVALNDATEGQIDNIETDLNTPDQYKADVTNLDVAISTRSNHADPTNNIKGVPGKTNQEVYDNEKGTDGAYTGTPPTVGEIRIEMEKAGTKLADVKDETAFIKSIEGGRWKIIDNQMVFYKDDNVTEVARFNLLDKDGKAAEENVMERMVV